MLNYFKLPEVKRTPLPRRCSNSTVALNTAQCLLSLLHTALALFNPGVSDRSLCSAAIQGARYLIHSFSSGALARTPPLREAARLLPAATRASDGKRALGTAGCFSPWKLRPRSSGPRAAQPRCDHCTPLGKPRFRTGTGWAQARPAHNMAAEGLVLPRAHRAPPEVTRSGPCAAAAEGAGWGRARGCVGLGGARSCAGLGGAPLPTILGASGRAPERRPAGYSRGSVVQGLPCRAGAQQRAGGRGPGGEAAPPGARRAGPGRGRWAGPRQPPPRPSRSLEAVPVSSRLLLFPAV